MFKVAFKNYPNVDFFFIAEILEQSKRRDLKRLYFSYLYSFFKLVTVIDNDVSFREKYWLDKVGDKAKLNNDSDSFSFMINE